MIRDDKVNKHSKAVCMREAKTTSQFSINNNRFKWSQIDKNRAELITWNDVLKEEI